jgi:serine/threonine protein phosphatase PrpC
MISVTSFSESGGHPVNEDAFVVYRHPFGSDCWICFLGDGQGGRAGGADASRIACRTAADAALNESPQALLNPAMWCTLLTKADRTVLAAPEAGFTTLLGFRIAGGILNGASSGDSAVLILSKGESARELTKWQIKNPPVGSGEARFVPFSASLVAPWSVLAMSDGVWKYIGWERLVQTAASSHGEHLVETLIAFARLPRSGQFQDDFTLVVLEEGR